MRPVVPEKITRTPIDPLTTSILFFYTGVSNETLITKLLLSSFDEQRRLRRAYLTGLVVVVPSRVNRAASQDGTPGTGAPYSCSCPYTSPHYPSPSLVNPLEVDRNSLDIT